jgi:hypothetical protein
MASKKRNIDIIDESDYDSDAQSILNLKILQQQKSEIESANCTINSQLDETNYIGQVSTSSNICFIPCESNFSRITGTIDESDDEVTIKDAPELMLSNTTDIDTVVFQISGLFYVLSVMSKEWSSFGHCHLKITQNESNGKQRILVRSNTGKILLNSFFYKHMNITSNG